MQNTRDISNKYTITLRIKFDELQEISEKLTPKDEYKNFVNAHMEAAAECIPTKLRAKHWVPSETLAVKKNMMWKPYLYVIYWPMTEPSIKRCKEKPN